MRYQSALIDGVVMGGIEYLAGGRNPWQSAAAAGSFVASEWVAEMSLRSSLGQQGVRGVLGYLPQDAAPILCESMLPAFTGLLHGLVMSRLSPPENMLGFKGPVVAGGLAAALNFTLGKTIHAAPSNKPVNKPANLPAVDSASLPSISI